MTAALPVSGYRRRSPRPRRNRDTALWLAIVAMVLLNSAVWGVLIALSRGFLTF